jgi:hypothetical protein
VFLLADGTRLRVSSSTNAGLILSSTIESDAEFTACVQRDALSSLLRGSTDVLLKDEAGRLTVIGRGVKGDVPSVIEEAPRVPKVTESATLSGKDADFLKTALAQVRLSALEREGLLSIQCAGGQWSVGSADDAHGAFMFGKGTATVRFGLFPQDAEVLAGVVAEAAGAVTIGTDGSVLVVRGRNVAVAIPTTEPSITTREDVESKSTVIAMIPIVNFRDAIAAMGHVASAADASPVSVRSSTTGVIRMSVTSPAGSISRDVRAKVREDVSFGMSHRLLSDLVARMADNAVLAVRRENSVVTQVNIKSGGATYSALTSE